MAPARRSTFNRRAQIAPPEVRRVVERQHGVISRPQLRAAGLSDAGVTRAAHRGWLVRVHPGVYAFGHTALAIEGRLTAALLYAGSGSALSHTTAAWWWGLTATAPHVIHVSTRRRLGGDAGLRLHRPRQLATTSLRGLAVTPVERTLLDLAAALRTRDLRRAVAEADHRRLLDPDAALSACGPGRPGARALRAALRHHLPELAATLSVLEERFVFLCERHCLPLPEVNARIAGHMVDMLWREHHLVVELDGHATHARAAAIEADRRRELGLRAAGLEVRRYTWAQITSDEARVAADLISALAC